ncbi:GGDEF domain-containing protein [Paenibacillus sp. YYML68]|uniref:GGDEF domain-containing protein n=1 Tax=Paenibacillus sp. YYML68 TaxID=2909250 RepID=UPI0024938280|nr:GGDEF domain-containing protein [Paenibacillus sp. YYML68]
MTDQNVVESSAGELQMRRDKLQQVIQQRDIHCVYQPIVSLKDGDILGFESLTRGPEDSPLHFPLDLFGLAKEEGLLYSLDQLARVKAIQGAALSSMNQLLFMNVSADILYDPEFAPGKTLELLRGKGLHPSNVVFEITERSSIEDFNAVKRILEHYRQQGYRIAIDDAGAGYSSLQFIAELNPHFIKIDRSLVHDVHRNKTKEYIMETMVMFAEKLGIHLIAEGIETADELMKLTRIGVHYGQGFLLGHPVETPSAITPDLQRQILEHRKINEMIDHFVGIGDISTPCQTFTMQTSISVVANFFKDNVNAQGAVIMKGQQPVGLIMRDRLFQQLAGQYGYSLFWNRSIDQLMDVSPLIVEEQTPVEHVSKLATSRDIRNLYDLVIVTTQGKLHGTASIRTILECITNAKMESAKVANPLTGLPGNLQINREISRKLADGSRFSVIYADLDYFKWFNDQFGFHKGDQLIQFTADSMQQAISLLGTPSDFVGHIGGDDFIAITTSPEPDRICLEMLRRFDLGVQALYDSGSFTYVEDRHGNRVDSEGVTLSLALVVCDPANMNITPDHISQVAAALKKKSKAFKGSVFFCDSIGNNAEDCCKSAALYK